MLGSCLKNDESNISKNILHIALKESTVPIIATLSVSLLTYILVRLYLAFELIFVLIILSDINSDVILM